MLPGLPADDQGRAGGQVRCVADRTFDDRHRLDAGKRSEQPVTTVVRNDLKSSAGSMEVHRGDPHRSAACRLNQSDSGGAERRFTDSQQPRAIIRLPSEKYERAGSFDSRDRGRPSWSRLEEPRPQHGEQGDLAEIRKCGRQECSVWRHRQTVRLPFQRPGRVGQHGQTPGGSHPHRRQGPRRQVGRTLRRPAADVEGLARRVQKETERIDERHGIRRPDPPHQRARGDQA